MPNFAPLLAVATATLDDGGILREANAGFLRMIGPHDYGTIGQQAAQYLIQPSFATLAGATARSDGEVYSGRMTVGDRMGKTSSLLGRAWHVPGELRIVAEVDIAEIEAINAVMTELNQRYADTRLELAQANLRLQQMGAESLAASLSDPLTDVGNRRRLEQALALEVGRAARTGDPLSLVMGDIDFFKRVNDTYGHDAGDKVLAAFGALLRRTTRLTDIVTRFGGEEFVVLMPHTDLPQAVQVAERVRCALAAQPIEPLPEAVTVSFGVATWAEGENGEALLQRADAAMYQAKQAGRNRVTAAR